MHVRQYLTVIFTQLYTGFCRANSFIFFINGYQGCTVFFNIFTARLTCNTLCKKIVTVRNASIPGAVLNTCSYVLFLLMFTGFAFCITHSQMKWPLALVFLRPGRWSDGYNRCNMNAREMANLKAWIRRYFNSKHQQSIIEFLDFILSWTLSKFWVQQFVDSLMLVPPARLVLLTGLLQVT